MLYLTSCELVYLTDWDVVYMRGLYTVYLTGWDVFFDRL